MGKRQGLSKAERITRKKDFDRAFQEGKRRGGTLMSVRYVANGLRHARLGIALGRGWRRAVARRRAKRLVREAFRTHKEAIPRGIDIIVVPMSGWRDPSVQDIANELIHLLRDAVKE